MSKSEVVLLPAPSPALIGRNSEAKLDYELNTVTGVRIKNKALRSLRHRYGTLTELLRNYAELLRNHYGTVRDPVQGLGKRLGTVYIDVSFP